MLSGLYPRFHVPFGTSDYIECKFECKGDYVAVEPLYFDTAPVASISKSPAMLQTPLSNKNTPAIKPKRTYQNPLICFFLGLSMTRRVVYLKDHIALLLDGLFIEVRPRMNT
jgi:hypothetical protein